MYSNIIGREVWEKCQKAKIWTYDCLARIEPKDNHLFDRIDICYDSNLEEGEIKYVDIVYYRDVLGGLGEETYNLADLPMNEQKEIFDFFMTELAQNLYI